MYFLLPLQQESNCMQPKARLFLYKDKSVPLLITHKVLIKWWRGPLIIWLYKILGKQSCHYWRRFASYFDLCLVILLQENSDISQALISMQSLQNGRICFKYLQYGCCSNPDCTESHKLGTSSSYFRIPMNCTAQPSFY